MYANRFFTLLIVVALASITALTVQEAVATDAVALAPQLHEAQRQRTRAAEVARWTAMGEYYENVEAGKIRRSRAAAAARWIAMGEYYQELAGDQVLSRAQSADTARWMAMSEYYRKLAEAQAQSIQRGRTADAARWTAMAEYYTQLLGTTR